MKFTETPWSEVPRVLYVTANQSDVCTMWRVWWPSLELTGRGYVADYCAYQDLQLFEPALRYGRYNTIVTPRMAFEAEEEEKYWLNIINTYRPKIKWWYDTDDDLLSRRIVDRLLATHRWPDPAKAEHDMETQRLSRVRLLAHADGVTVATEPLIAIAAEYCPKRIMVVPNGINAQPYIAAATQGSERTIPPLTIGWSGGPRLESDLEPLYEVWPKLAEVRPDVHFVLQGWVPPRMLSLLPANRLHCMGGLQNEQYHSFLRNIDIFCCPSPPDEWAGCKSPIKFLEATLAGATCVVSDRVYGDVVRAHCIPNKPAIALVAHDASEWLRYLLYLVDEPLVRQKMHAEAQAVVLREHTSQKTYADWLATWSTALRDTVE
jgi:glycosyltransferase involved in cell wall biosynthesis